MDTEPVDASIDIDSGDDAPDVSLDADPDADVEPDVDPTGCEDPWAFDPLADQPRGELPTATTAHEGLIDGEPALVASRDDLPPVIIEVAESGRVRIVAEVAATATTQVVGAIGERWYLLDWPGGSITEATIDGDGAVTVLDEHVRAVGLPHVSVHRDAIAFIDGSGMARVGPWRETLDATIEGAHPFGDAATAGVKLIDGPNDGAPFIAAFQEGDVRIGRVPLDDSPTVLGSAPLPNATPYDVDVVLPPGGGWVVVGHNAGWSLFWIDGTGLTEVDSVAERTLGPIREVAFLEPPTTGSPDARIALAGDGFTRVLRAEDDAFTWSAALEGWAWLGGAPLVERDGRFFSLESARPVDVGGVPFLPVPRDSGSTTAVDLDGDGQHELFVAAPETYATNAWRVDRAQGPTSIEHAYNGLAARYDSCEPVPSDAGGQALVCQGNFLVRLELIDGLLNWSRYGTDYFDLLTGVSFGRDRVAAGPGYAVITVDLSNFDGMGVFPMPELTDTRATFVVPADTAVAPFPAGSEPDLLGNTTYRGDRGEIGWVTWGGSGLRPWSVVSLEDGTARADAPETGAAIRDVAAFRMPRGRSDELIVALDDGIRRLAVGANGPGGSVIALGAPPVAVWGRRGDDNAMWAAVSETGSVWVGEPPLTGIDPHPVASLALEPVDIAGGDFDGDGTTDLAVASNNPDGVAFLLTCSPASD